MDLIPYFQNADNDFNCQGVYKVNLCNQLVKINFDDCDGQLLGYVFKGCRFLLAAS